MNEPRYASLSGSLLARKGGAKPAMRPRPLSQGQMLDDLGWDDMGDAHEQPTEHVPSSIAGLTPAPKPPVTREEAAVSDEPVAPVHVQRRALAERFGPVKPVEPAPLPEAVVTSFRAPTAKPRNAAVTRVAGKKAAFTLRLDGDRHLKLRLASAITGKSSQQLVTGALDSFLETLPEIGTLARHVPARSGAGN